MRKEIENLYKKFNEIFSVLQNNQCTSVYPRVGKHNSEYCIKISCIGTPYMRNRLKSLISDQVNNVTLVNETETTLTYDVK